MHVRFRRHAPLAMLCAKQSSWVHQTPRPLPELIQPTSPALPWPGAAQSPLHAASEECALPPDAAEDNFSRYSRFLVRNSNGVDGMGRLNGASSERREEIFWLDTLGDDECTGYQYYDEDEPDEPQSATPSPFSVLSWNILAQSLYEAQYQRRRIQQVATSGLSAPVIPSLTSNSHPHPWPKRLKRIIEMLSHANSDVVCLQECELQTFKYDLAPALSKLGYDGIAQEDDRPDRPARMKEVTKHRYPRNHIVATFWKKDKFQPVGETLVRTRTMTTVLRLKENSGDAGDGGGGAAPTVAVINVHLEGHPRRFSERTHQLQHAMTDLSKRIEHERKDPESLKGESRIGKLNALVLAGDFNCELQSSACSTYLRMGRLGKQVRCS